ncbi:MAG: ion transporter [Flavobacteriales bacterium]|nr:ion transporter [Flavobacteriales bacterium]
MITRDKIHEIIFEADTKAGKRFDICLIIFILLSVFGVMLSSVSSIDEQYGYILHNLEWFFTFLFTIEYMLRIYSVQKPWKYIFSFMGIVDFLAIIPTYLVFIYAPIGVLVDIRILRLLRIFRVFKLSSYIRGAYTMQIALRSSRPKIIVFLLSVVLLVVLLGTLMYVVEGQQNGFDNIPKSIYWSVVTLTTVGYGDVVPVTALGKLIASVIMIMGYGIIAVPTGIVSADMAKHSSKSISTQACRSCSKDGHDVDATHCKFCGEQLNE